MIKKMGAVMLFMAVLIMNNSYANNSRYLDVPENSWATVPVYAAKDFNIMEGTGDNLFGFGKTIKKSEFVTIINKMFKWELITPETSSFSDVSKNAWYYPYIETALKHNVFDKTELFEPQKEITREEMAVMLVRALGYSEIAKNAEGDFTVFNDITSNIGYINVAYDIGMTKGTSSTTFSPKQTAKREEAATMMVNIYKKFTKETDWINGFYAFSSYAGRDAARSMDTVSFGWSKMCWNEENGAYLNTGSLEGNTWKIPESYEMITSYLEDSGAEMKLSVYMDTTKMILEEDGTNTNTLNKILLNKNSRTQAVRAITEELTKIYDAIGKNPYSGVTIDFEGLKNESVKEGFNEFLKELSGALKPLGKTLYVTVQPVLHSGTYFDGFDYKTIGAIADKVILMAHDYNTTSLNGFEGTTYYRTTALTPISDVYYSIKAITDKDTGVEDLSKIAIALSFSSIGWKISDNETLISGTPVNPSVETIYNRLNDRNTKMGYSEIYENPYITYKTKEGENIFLWYEDERSADAKIKLAKLFGITGVSVWRIGNIPNYQDEGLFYNVIEILR